jgi:hypothetical protein
MSTTTIKRKALRNRVKAKQRKASIKRLTSKPTLKNIDLNAIKSTFEKEESKKKDKKAEISEEPVTTKKELANKNVETVEKVATDKPTAEKKASEKAKAKEIKTEKPKTDTQEKTPKADPKGKVETTSKKK